MPKRLHVRILTAEEERALEKLMRSQNAPVRLALRATIIRLSYQGYLVSHIAEQLHIDEDVVRKWIKRFSELGLAGLEDAPRSGAPARYTPEHKAQVLQTARTHPKDLGLPFRHWTFDRLTAYVHKHLGIQMKRTRIVSLVREEGVRWRKEEQWFEEQLDTAGTLISSELTGY